MAISKIIFTLALFVWTLLPLQAQDQVEKQEIAKEILNHFRNGTSSEIIGYFDGTMKEHLTAGQLESIWKGILQQFGDFEGVEETRVETRDEYMVVVQKCKFKTTPLLFNLTFDKDNKIAGMFFRPVQSP